MVAAGSLYTGPPPTGARRGPRLPGRAAGATMTDQGQTCEAHIRMPFRLQPHQPRIWYGGSWSPLRRALGASAVLAIAPAAALGFYLLWLLGTAFGLSLATSLLLGALGAVLALAGMLAALAPLGELIDKLASIGGNLRLDADVLTLRLPGPWPTERRMLLERSFSARGLRTGSGDGLRSYLLLRHAGSESVCVAHGSPPGVRVPGRFPHGHVDACELPSSPPIVLEPAALEELLDALHERMPPP